MREGSYFPSPLDKLGFLNVFTWSSVMVSLDMSSLMELNFLIKIKCFNSARSTSMTSGVDASECTSSFFSGTPVC